MSHLYTSLAFALKTNTELLQESSSGFRELVNQITTKNFSGEQSDHQHHIKFAMKKAAKMITRHNHNYLVNRTMRDELNLLSSALSPESGIKFETPIAHLILRIPTASIIGDSSLVALAATLSPYDFGGTSPSRRKWSSECSCISRTTQTGCSSLSTAWNM